MGGKALGGLRVPRNQAVDLFNSIKNELEGKFSELHLCGSARRLKETCGDIDIVFIDNENNEVKEWLSENFGTQKNGKPKRTGLMNGIQVEFYEATSETLGSNILMWTGPAGSNVRMRRICKKRGFKMSQYGIKNENGENLTSKMNEQQIYNFLGLNYVEPQNRK